MVKANQLFVAGGDGDNRIVFVVGEVGACFALRGIIHIKHVAGTRTISCVIYVDRLCSGSAAFFIR